MISSYADRQNDKYISIRKVADFISNLKQDTNKLDFIHNHLFNFNKSDFEDFVKGVINKYNIYRLSINKNKLNIGAVAKDTFTIKALFWHDAFIFDLIEAIHSFNSGFAKVLEVNITKIATNTEESPAIEAEITCIVFCSK
jgi:hypothetical protein